MILPDVNVLIHAYNSGSNRHKTARDWWERTLRLPRPVGLPWAVILGFIRIATNLLMAASEGAIFAGPVWAIPLTASSGEWPRHSEG